jgi:hypothetical protein
VSFVLDILTSYKPINTTTMKNLTNQVAEIQAVINQAITDDVMAIEVDSTWETGYQFKSIELLKTKIKISYSEYNGRWEDKVDSYKLSDTEDVKYIFSWIKRCIRKGYKEEAKEQKLESLNN